MNGGTPTIARDFKIGETRIKIATDFCVSSREEIDAILARIADNAQRALSVGKNKDTEVVYEQAG